MIKSLSSHYFSAQEAIFLFNGIRVVGLQPDSYSFPFVLKAVTRLSNVNVGRQIHGLVIKNGFDEEIHVAIASVQMYSSGGWVEDARKVFDEMSSSNDVALWNAMAAGYAGIGSMDKAKELFEYMRERNVISWTTIIAGYVHVNQPNKAIEVFRRMQGDGVKPDEVALLAALSACADLGALELGEQIHDSIDKHIKHKTIPLYNALIDMYVKSGNIEKAQSIFSSMEHKSTVTWTTMIAGMAFHGHGREALEMFTSMERARVRANDITFIGVLSACSHIGLVELGQSYFNCMSSKYGIIPKIQHYGCMVDLLARVGRLDEAEDLITIMPLDANAAIWGSLLAAAKIHGDSALASKAFQWLSILEPNNGGNYALLSNTFAALGRWNEARLVRNMMRSSGVKKFPGESFIEVNNGVYSFVAGNVCHPEAKEIYDVVGEINQQCRMQGCEQCKQELFLVE